MATRTVKLSQMIKTGEGYTARVVDQKVEIRSILLEAAMIAFSGVAFVVVLISLFALGPSKAFY